LLKYILTKAALVTAITLFDNIKFIFALIYTLVVKMLHWINGAYGNLETGRGWS
jgi:hypothetical protein